MKPLLIIQPYFVGDLYYCIKLAQVWAERGHRVIFPIQSRFKWVRDSLVLPHGVEMPLIETEPFDFNREYITIFNEANHLAVRGDHRLHQGVTETSDFLFLALESSWRLNMRETMLTKYLMGGVDHSDWADYVHLRRDISREQALLKHLDITPTRQFIMINEHCSQGHFPIPRLAEDEIKMSIVPGYSLIDWLIVAEAANAIVTIDTSLVLLVEVLKLNKPLQVLNRYPVPDFRPIEPIIRLPWHKAYTTKDLIPYES